MTEIPAEAIPTIRWADGNVRILDQRALPRRETFRLLREPVQLIRAIRSLAVRGAPALGIAGAYGIARIEIAFDDPAEDLPAPVVHLRKDLRAVVHRLASRAGGPIRVKARASSIGLAFARRRQV